MPDGGARVRAAAAAPILDAPILDAPILDAAVLVPVVLAAEPFILLTRRAAALRRHAGQVSFPGGRIDPHDRDAAAAALREAEEEIALDPDRVRVLGALPPHDTSTGFSVTPIVGLVDRDATFRAAPDEVEAILRLPLATLLDPSAPFREEAMFAGRARSFWVWPHPEERIWGATAAILKTLADRLRVAMRAS